jgi:hypothetical protein
VVPALDPDAGLARWFVEGVGGDALAARHACGLQMGGKEGFTPFLPPLPEHTRRAARRWVSCNSSLRRIYSQSGRPDLDR